MSNRRQYDLVILGGGAIGLSAALSAFHSMNGHPTVDASRILVIDQFDFANDRSSSAGRFRQFRYQYSQPYMSELVMRATPRWDALSALAGKPLIGDSGCLWFGDAELQTTEGGIGAARQTMAQLGIPSREISAEDLHTEFGFSGLPADYAGFLQPGGGTIDFETTIDVLLRECVEHGVHMAANERITHIDEDAGQAVLVSDTSRYRAKSLVIATGPFLNESLSTFGRKAPVKIWDMVSCYFPIRDGRAYLLPTWFAFQKPNDRDSNLYYGFPEVPSGPPGHVRVCPDYPFAMYDDPRQRKSPVAADYQGTADWVANHMPGLMPRPAFHAQCMLALATNQQPLFLDLVSRHPNVAVCGAGWCAKIAPELGNLAAQLALRGKTSFDITPFALGDAS